MLILYSRHPNSEHNAWEIFAGEIHIFFHCCLFNFVKQGQVVIHFFKLIYQRYVVFTHMFAAYIHLFSFLSASARLLIFSNHRPSKRKTFIKCCYMYSYFVVFLFYYYFNVEWKRIEWSINEKFCCKRVSSYSIHFQFLYANYVGRLRQKKDKENLKVNTTEQFFRVN